MSGASQREIARTVGPTQATVNRVLQVFRKKGRIHSAACHSTQKTTDEEDRAIVDAASIAPSMTPSQIGDTLGLNECEQRIGSATTSRSRPQAQKPLLSDVTKRKRLDFAYAHAQYAADDWWNVVFTNECSICTEWNQKQKVY